MSYFQWFERWLTTHAIAVQALTAVFGAILTLILVMTTIAYLREARKSRRAAEHQAEAAQGSLALLKQERFRTEVIPTLFKAPKDHGNVGTLCLQICNLSAIGIRIDNVVLQVEMAGWSNESSPQELATVIGPYGNADFEIEMTLRQAVSGKNVQQFTADVVATLTFQANEKTETVKSDRYTASVSGIGTYLLSRSPAGGSSPVADRQ